MASATDPTGVGPRITALDALRFFSELIAFAALALWGFLAWDAPWSFVWGFGAPLIAIFAWALFLSPKAVFHLPRFVRAVIELLVFVSATLALWGLGLPWAGLAVGIFCIVIGVLVGRRDLR